MRGRMLRNQLTREDIHVSRRHIGRLMRRMGIVALGPQPGTSKAAPGHKIYFCLLRKLLIVRANQRWALDITYIPMAKGFVYQTGVVDVASRCAPRCRPRRSVRRKRPPTPWTTLHLWQLARSPLVNRG